jgi:hypothetical protein
VSKAKEECEGREGREVSSTKNSPNFEFSEG